MASIIECSQASTSQRNTGADEQCLVAPVVKYVLAGNDQKFATKELAKTLASWKTGIASKDLIPLYAIEVLANANIEATFYEARNRYQTKAEKKVVTSEYHLGVCSYGALLSYSGKKMRLYEFSDDGKLSGVTDEEGTIVKGQLVTIEVGMLIASVDDKPQTATVTITYEDWKEFVNNPAILVPSWSHLELNGIFDANINIVSASATSVKFTVGLGCNGDIVKSLEDTDLTFKKPDGTPITHSFVAADANGVYGFIGTGFAAGDLIGLNGVISQPERILELLKEQPITIS